MCVLEPHLGEKTSLRPSESDSKDNTICFKTMLRSESKV